MVHIPDSWPPDPDGMDATAAGTGLVVPVFPLPGVFLFPGQIMPLHIFEPRYRQMIDDSLDGPGRLAIGTVLEKDRTQLSGAPPFMDVAGVGEIARHEKLPDGRFLIWLCGIGRARITEVASDRQYRRVRCETIEETDPTVEDELVLRAAVCQALRERTGDSFDTELEDEVPLGLLADVLAQSVTAPEPVLADLHAEHDVAERARKALAAHERFPTRRRSE